VDKLAIIRDGTEVPPCTALGAVPDPCVESRTRAGNGFGDAIIVVRTTKASDWTFEGDVCGDAPAAGCFAAAPRGGKLKLFTAGGGVLPRLTWAWKAAPETAVEVFGDPAASNDFTLCAYDATGRVLSATAPAGGACGSKPCWKALGSGLGFRYADKELDPHGVVRVKLKAGALGKGRAKVVARGPSLPVPGLPLDGPVRVQLRSSEGACFEATFTTSKQNNAGAFVAVSD
jgi:hypothetical protein